LPLAQAKPRVAVLSPPTGEHLAGGVHRVLPAFSPMPKVGAAGALIRDAPTASHLQTITRSRYEHVERGGKLHLFRWRFSNLSNEASRRARRLSKDTSTL
jgi:hypothetical protein